MKKISKILSLVLAICLFWNLCPWLQMVSHAAVTPMTLRVASFSEGTLNLTWIALPGTKSVTVTYHKPPAIISTTNVNQETNTVSISGLSSDIIYDIKVEVYDDEDGGGALIGKGFVYFLPRMSFYSTVLAQERHPISGGGFETGIEPKLNLKWAMPKVWDGDAGTFNYVNLDDSLDYMKGQINSVYDSSLTLEKLNFKINISNSSGTLNSGSAQASVNIEFDGTDYNAWVSGVPGVTAKVNNVDADGIMNFNVLGKADSSSDFPEPYDDDVFPDEDVLPDADFLPGSIYYMSIRMVFKNASGTIVNAVSTGPESDMNCSSLLGETAYTYTPIRFQLSRDAMDNIYIKVYKINQGTLSLPRLFYEVQSADDPSSPGDWPIKKSFDDSFFAEDCDYTINVITGVSPENTIYYKVVVKTESTSDRLESSSMAYCIAEDSSKSPVPKNVTFVSAEYVTKTVETGSGTIQQKSSDITISWDKPSNWSEIVENTDPDNDVVYHCTLNTYFTEVAESTDGKNPELIADGESYGEYSVRYRREIFFSSKKVNVIGNHLQYTIKGFELFKGEYFSGVDGDGNPEFTTEAIENDDSYPTFLLPNKTYYLQMYTTSGADRNTTDTEKMSDKSVIISFTTKSGIDMDVPLAKSLKVTKNSVSVAGTPAITTNTLELEFGKIDINWSNYVSDVSVAKSVYYDVYMSNRSETGSFIYIGSTQYDDEDVAFEGHDDTQSNNVKATINEFSSDTDAFSVFGEKLKPNTTYYFAVKTRLLIGEGQTKESRLTSALPVTTVKGVVEAPEESSKRPLAPVDFAIAQDTKGNSLVTSSSAIFKWLSQEDNVIFQIACSSEKLNEDNESTLSVSDSVYKSFNSVFGEILLNPANPSTSTNFEYSQSTKACKYSVCKWLLPNNLYYFSIRAIDKTDSRKYSEWVSIPVTTSLIDSPSVLEVLNDAEVAFYWTCEDLTANIEDFGFYIKKSHESSYTELQKTNYVISKDGNDFFGRISDLEFSSTYSVKVVKGVNKTLICEKTGLTTRDQFHEIEIKWKGSASYTYDIAIKSLKDSDYTTLSESDLKSCTNYNGKVLSYYLERNSQMSETDYAYHYARIQKRPVLLLDGTMSDKVLDSNTKYYIKVRASNVDPLDTTIISYSKYVGPAIKRTEYYEADFIEDQKILSKKASILSQIENWGKTSFWKVGLKDTSKRQIFLKSEQVVNSISNGSSNSFTVDISSIGTTTPLDVVYIPIDIINQINLQNKNLIIKSTGASFTIRPSTLDESKTTAIQNIANDSNVKDLFIKVQIKNDPKSSIKLPTGTKEDSRVYSLEAVAEGTTKTYDQLKTMFDDKLNNKETGIVQNKLNSLLSSTSSTDGILGKSVTEIVSDIETELSTYILGLVGRTGNSTTVYKYETIKNFEVPMLVSINQKSKNGLKQPYVYYSGYTAWQKVTNGVQTSTTSININVLKPGKYVLLLTQSEEDISIDFAGKDELKVFASKYEIAEILGPIKTFVPEQNLKIKELILLFEKIMDKKSAETGLSIKEKADNYGIGMLASQNQGSNDIQKQEFAYVLMKIFSDKMAIKLEEMAPKGDIYINDEDKIDVKFYKAVYMAEDFDLLQLDEQENFEPYLPVSRINTIRCLTKVLRLTGDLE